MKTRNLLTKAVAIALAAVMILPASGITAQAAKKQAKLSKSTLALTDADETYKLSVSGTGKKDKIKWSVKQTSDDESGKAVSYTVSKNKKSISIKALANGSGTFTCKAGKKSLKCNFTVTLSTLDQLRVYIDQNGEVNGDGDKLISADLDNGSIFLSNSKDNSVFIRTDLSDGSEYTDTTWITLYKDGTGTVAITKSKSDNEDDMVYDASVDDDFSLSQITKANNIKFNIDSKADGDWNTEANKALDTSLAAIDTYFTTKGGFGLADIGIVNYK